MPGEYKYIDHTADIAVEVTADNLNDLFISAAESWENAVLEKFETTQFEFKTYEISESSIEELLVSFLDELNFLLLVKKWVFTDVKNLTIQKVNEKYNLKVEVYGEVLNEKKHILKAEIKAVTFHQMDVKYKDGKYSTRIVFDI